MVEYRTGPITPQDFNALTEKVGWGVRDAALVEKALARTLYAVCAWDGGRLIGYGRLIGDETVFLYVQDVMVDPVRQGQGVGSAVMERLVGQIREYKKNSPGLRVYLGASAGRESFYKKFGFKTRSELGLGEGMVWM